MSYHTQTNAGRRLCLTFGEFAVEFDALTHTRVAALERKNSGRNLLTTSVRIDQSMQKLTLHALQVKEVCLL
jgi:hypothetical protein